MEEIVTEFESILIYKLRLIKGDASFEPFSPRTYIHVGVLYSNLLLTSFFSHVDRGSDPPQVWEFHISWSHPCSIAGQDMGIYRCLEAKHNTSLAIL